ncbi:hypothetical protein C3747_15g141 [Trypanosoma cruzi]|uniref:RNase H n=1 Tax=Trypanosoma cruzi TaxID=5693 RepID=A0A2V2XB02_TRYCR|nr:hypothetical protein C3747_15g127 [Trypanosoma cruzi]PWV17996.1 hypothetical protein C3747_15g141 [Trypanosoma cruzi]
MPCWKQSCSPSPTRCWCAASAMRSDVRRVAVLCGLAPPSPATRSTPPENHTTPSWPSALRLGWRLAAHPSQWPLCSPQLASASTFLPMVPLQMTPTKLDSNLAAAGSPAASDAKACRHTQKENVTMNGQTAPWNSESNVERRRYCALMERRSTLPGPARDRYHAATEPSASPYVLVQKAIEQHSSDKHCAVWSANFHWPTLPSHRPQTVPLTVSDPILRRLWTLLLRLRCRGARIWMHSVLGHCGVSRNEACDAVATRASEPAQFTDTWTTGMVALARRIICARRLKAETRRSTATCGRNPTRTDSTLTREEEAALDRFRTGVPHRYV